MGEYFFCVPEREVWLDLCAMHDLDAFRDVYERS